MTFATALNRRLPTGSMQHLPGVGNARETAAFAAGALLIVCAVFASSAALTSAQNITAQPLPPPPAMAVRDLAPEAAVKVNQAIPLANIENPASQAFRFAGSTQSRAAAEECLASAIYYEAGSESADGQRAVAQVVLNRVRHPAFPSSICGVVYQGSTRSTGCQFTFTCDGSLARRPDPTGWKRAQALAEAALSGSVYAPAGLATHYHANYVVPVWAAEMAKNAVVGAHLFYRWHGTWGRPDAFVQRYVGREASASALRSAALAAFAMRPAPAASAPALARLEGVEQLPITPSMRGQPRFKLRFNQVAREAADSGAAKVAGQDYADRMEASDNLRWSLSSEPSAAAQKPLGPQSPVGGSGAHSGGATPGQLQPQL